jgi:general stress protein 26
VAQVEANGNLWFATDRESGKMHELDRDSHVNVTMQGNNKFVSISGVATVHDDRRKINELWAEDWRVWYPGGKDDPSLVLLKVNPSAGEYWDNTGARGLKFLLEAGKAYFSGERPEEDDPQTHSKVKL